MNNKILLLAVFIFIIAAIATIRFANTTQSDTQNSVSDNQQNYGLFSFDETTPLSIAGLQKGEYPGSDIEIEETLEPGDNYRKYLASYKSEGLKIYALLTVPDGEPPTGGWPAIVFNHGYIPPLEYRTTEGYIAYTDAFSRNGYVLIKPDYRGHGNSEGSATGGYGSNAYTIDVLNALSSLKKYPGVNPQKIGMWGHSMGGFVTLRSMVTNRDIKAGVIWGGVVASYPDLLYSWRRGSFPTPSVVPSGRRRWRDQLIEKFGTPEKNPVFWSSISANSFLKDISGPIQLHHSTTDDSVPVEFSEKLEKEMKAANKPVELHIYEGDDHNISVNFNTAMERSVAFFDRYLKNSKK